MNTRESRIASRRLNKQEYDLWIHNRADPNHQWWTYDHYDGTFHTSDTDDYMLEDAYWMPNHYANLHRHHLYAKSQNTLRWIIQRRRIKENKLKNEFQMLLLKIADSRRGLGIDFYRNIRMFF